MREDFDVFSLFYGLFCFYQPIFLKFSGIYGLPLTTAPAAAETIQSFLRDTDTKPSDYDLILTGDLGKVGSELLIDLLIKDFNIDISSVHNDCGLMIYDLEEQDMHAGGSGCGCSAAVVNSIIMKNLTNGSLKRVLFVGTGALLSTTSSLQGESVPGIAHGVLLTNGE